MKTKAFVILLALLGLLSAIMTAAPLGTAFSYQGRLNDGGQPASGIYDFRFAIYGAAGGGSAVAGPITNAATAVSNGLFTVSLDFGEGVFTGDARWLEIGVRANGSAEDFSALSPRQLLTPAPYALYAPSAGAAVVAVTAGRANAVAAADVTGTLTLGQLPGVLLTNGQSGVSLWGVTTLSHLAVTGTNCANYLVVTNPPALDGSAVSNLNAGQLASGTLPDVRLSANVALLKAHQAFSGSNRFAGVLVATNLSNVVVGRFSGDGAGLSNLPPANLSAGTAAIDISGAAAAAPWAGLIGMPAGFADGVDHDTLYAAGPGLSLSGTLLSLNTDYTDGRYWKLGGNSGTAPGTHFLGTTDDQPFELKVNGTRALRLEYASNVFGVVPNVIGGAPVNAVASGVVAATIGGGGEYGLGHRISGDFSTIAGGRHHSIEGFGCVIGGGQTISIATNCAYSAVAGGWAITVDPNASYAAIGGGSHHWVQTHADYAAVGGGFSHRIGTNTTAATVAGGWENVIATSTGNATVGGGRNNRIGTNSWNATIAGGADNLIVRENATIAGGVNNLAAEQSATVGGGDQNVASGWRATVPGGFGNTAAGTHSFAAGRRGKANHEGAFVWADSTDADFASTGNNQFLVRAAGGVGINRNNPATALDVAGAVSATAFTGSGAGLTDLNGGALAAGSVGNAALAAGAITGAKIADGTIQAADISPATFAGVFWKADGNAGTIPGTHFAGTTDNQPLEFKVNGRRALRLEPHPTCPNMVGGFSGNLVGSGVYGATIGGGGGLGASNAIYGHYAIVAGGLGNTIGTNSYYSAIGGGMINTIAQETRHATIAGGNDNGIGTNADWIAIGGGYQNYVAANTRFGSIAGGLVNTIGTNSWCGTIGGGTANSIAPNAVDATIPGGNLNTAASYAFAAGRRAKANHIGAFVWADSADADFASTADNQFLIRATGGVGIGGAPQDALLDIEGHARLNNSDLFLRHEADRNHGLGWYGTHYEVKPFAGVDVDGPVLYGWNGGVLGSTIGGQKVALRWTADARVGIGTTSPAMSLHVASPSGPASAVIGQNHESGGYAALVLGVGAVSNSYAYLQGVRAAGTSYGNLALNASGGNVGVGTIAPGQKLHVAGRIRMGTWEADGTTAVYRNGAGDLALQSSDRRLKENIAPITNALAAVRGLTGVTFNWRGEPVGEAKTVGLIAQDVRATLPELTFECRGEDGETYLGVHYEKVAVVLANAVNELHYDFEARLDQKDAEIQRLTQRLARLEELVEQLAR